MRKIPKWIKRAVMGVCFPFLLAVGMAANFVNANFFSLVSAGDQINLAITVFYGTWTVFTGIWFGIMLLYELRDID